MDDPDVILRVDGDADRLAKNPLVWQRLRPQRIDFESWRLYAADGGFHRGAVIERRGPPAEPGEHRDESCSHTHLSRHKSSARAHLRERDCRAVRAAARQRTATC